MVGELEFRAIESVCWDADARLADMDADGVDLQVVSPTPVFFSYDRPADQAHQGRPDLQRPHPRVRRRTSGSCRSARCRCRTPTRRAPSSTAASPPGTPGVEIGNHVGDRDLDDAGIVAFLQHCAEVGAPGARAPVGHAGRTPARPVDGPLAGRDAGRDAPVVAGDDPRRRVRRRAAASLRICFAHGGGSFAFWLGRLDNAWHRRGDIVRGRSQHPPSHYVDRFFVDSVVFDAAPLRLLVDTLGEDQVMVGSDYPYPLGERPAGNVVRPPSSSPTTSATSCCRGTRSGSSAGPDPSRLRRTDSPGNESSHDGFTGTCSCRSDVAFDSARAGRGPAKRRHVTGSEAVTRGPVLRASSVTASEPLTRGPERRHQADPTRPQEHATEPRARAGSVAAVSVAMRAYFFFAHWRPRSSRAAISASDGARTAVRRPAGGTGRGGSGLSPSFEDTRLERSVRVSPGWNCPTAMVSASPATARNASAEPSIWADDVCG